MFIGYKDGSIIFGGTTNQPHDNLVITLDEMEQLAAFYQHEQDKTAVKEYLKTAINILGSAEISTELAKKYLYDAGLLDQLVEESNHSQENFGDNFLTSIAKGIEALEKRLDVKEWEGLPEPVANRMAHEFIAERNPCRWTGSGDAPDDVGFEPLNLPIDDIYPKGDKPVLRIQNLEDFDEACEALDSCGVKFELDGGDRIMVEDELRQDALSVFDEYDIDAEEV